LAVFVSPKREFRAEGNQVQKRVILEYELEKPPKGYSDPLRGFTAASSGTPTFSFYSSEG
jgi:hypothetical protein